MREYRFSCVPVVEGERLVGIVTTRDLSGRVLAEGRAPDTPWPEIMTPDPLSL
jgi:CBS domain-containing protein